MKQIFKGKSLVLAKPLPLLIDFLLQVVVLLCIFLIAFLSGRARFITPLLLLLPFVEILEEGYYYHHKQHADGEGGDNRQALKAVKRVLGKE